MDLPESLLRQARGWARASGTTLSAVVVEALRIFLSSSLEPAARYEVLTYGTPGGRFPSERETRDVWDSDDVESLRLSRDKD